MLYAFPDNLFLDHHGTKLNRHLSLLDEKFIGRLYPKPG
jgi:hypothetical protein